MASQSEAEEALVQQAIAQSLNEAPAAFEGSAVGASEEEDLQRALRESVALPKEDLGVRPLMGPEGPFFPAGLLNSGNSCFWNALVQALFFATPVFRGALFQLDLKGDSGACELLESLCRLFAEMDMGLAGAIDAGKLYRMIFQQAEEADVSEQMHHLFHIASQGPPSLKAVWQELFSGDLFEQLRSGESRRSALDLCQLDLCVTKPAALPELLEDHAQDVQGSIVRRSYRLPPVLWLNLDRFAYDRVAQCGKKRQVKVTFPQKLNTWMLAPLEAPWAAGMRKHAEKRRSIREELAANQQVMSARTAEVGSKSESLVTEHLEQDMLEAAEQQEGLSRALQEVEEELQRAAEEQELVYELRAVIIHRGFVDSGHYFAYVRSPAGPQWCCLNDATVSLCEEEEMRRVAEGTTVEGAPGATEAEVTPEAPIQELLVEGEAAPPAPQAWWPSMTSIFGCLPGPGRPSSIEEFGLQEPATGSHAPSSVLPSFEEPEKPKSDRIVDKGPSSTEARCLVYARCGVGSDRLLDEVRQRVPPALQEQIDVCNQKVLGGAVDRAVADFALCARQLQAGEGTEREELQAFLQTASWVRLEAGMGMARAYLLRACWRRHVPWLPEARPENAEASGTNMYCKDLHVTLLATLT
ncbi:unnamed protein product [Effrenium voratum]|uniref:USP domain-containing protein n=1 Tax=Effrenium voratum TaxID=2562239 RepID=A0AA36HXE5_9DINO|nr:unnamed protein product [Effrenium voratum]